MSLNVLKWYRRHVISLYERHGFAAVD